MASNNPPSNTTAAAITDGIVTRGCTHLFGLMGDGNMHLFTELGGRGVALVEVRHESAAVAMAEGYAWATGTIGFCSVTHGPGLTHVATSLVVATRNRSPLVLIAAETPTGYLGAQSFDQSRFIAACDVPYRRLNPGEDPTAVMDEVCDLAIKQTRPVVLGVPADLLRATAGTDLPQPNASAPVERPSAIDDELAAAAILEALTNGQRSVLIAGRGAQSDAARRSLICLADRFGAALATTIPAKGMFDEHPSNLGVSGGLSHPEAKQLLQQADVVITVGSSLDRGTTSSGRLFPDAQLYQLINERPANAPRGNVQSLYGDAEHTLALLEMKASTQHPREPWCGPFESSVSYWQQDLVDFAPPIAPGTVDPREAITTINELLPEDALVVISNGHCSGFSATFLDKPRHGGFFAAHGFGAIGQAMTAAIGAALGAPGRKVVCLEGDAGFMMHAQELDTAARAGADLTVIVINDEALGTEYQRLAAEGDGGADLATVKTFDLAALGKVFGAHAYAVRDSATTRDAARAALAPGLGLIDLRIDRSVLSRHMRGLRTAGVGL